MRPWLQQYPGHLAQLNFMSILVTRGHYSFRNSPAKSPVQSRSIEKFADDGIQPVRSTGESHVVGIRQHAQLGVRERVEYFQCVLERDGVSIARDHQNRL